MIDNYHLPRKNASYRLVILRWHLWGGIFQMAVIGERQVTGENGRIFQTEKSRYALNMRGFGPGDNCRIRAGIWGNGVV